MNYLLLPALVALVVLPAVATTPARSAEDPWTICVANNNCQDSTWGLTDEQTRQAFADVVKCTTVALT